MSSAIGYQVSHHGHDHRAVNYVHQNMAPPAGTQTRHYQPLWTRRAADEAKR